MSFTDVLNRPLPSKVNKEDTVATESTNTEFTPEEYLESMEAELFDTEEGCENNSCAESDDIELGDVEDMSSSDDDFNPDDMSDEELAALDAELSDDAIDSVVDSEDEVDLSPEEEIEADDMMSLAATTFLVNDELNAQERAEFVQTQGEIAVNEGFMSETDVNEIALESGLVQEANYNKKMIIRLDAESKKKQLYALAINVSAAAHGDPDYIKLKKVMKMRKILRAKLERKYHGEATKRMKIYFNRLRRSKSGVLSKIGDKLANKEEK